MAFASRRVVGHFLLRCNRVLQSVCDRAAISPRFDYFLPPCPLQFLLFVVLLPGRGNHFFHIQARCRAPLSLNPCSASNIRFKSAASTCICAGRDVVIPACFVKSQYTDYIFRAGQSTNIAVRCPVSKQIKSQINDRRCTKIPKCSIY